jgi:hypothetical protein
MVHDVILSVSAVAAVLTVAYVLEIVLLPTLQMNPNWFHV